jgi:hypothetical protein
MSTRGMYDTWISGSDVNSFCCYGLVYLLDSWQCLRSLIEVHLHFTRIGVWVPSHSVARGQTDRGGGWPTHRSRGRAGCQATHASHADCPIPGAVQR